MKECRWLILRLIGQFEFVEWTPDGHRRPAPFLGLREDKDPKEVRRNDYGDQVTFRWKPATGQPD
jgi:bifunctional non-homologous end joining protein LigD